MAYIPDSTWIDSDKQGMITLGTMGSDEYPTGITFTSGEIRNISHGDTETLTMCVCDSTGANEYTFFSVSLDEATYHEVSSSDKDGNQIWIGGWFTKSVPVTNANRSGQNWTNLTGKTVCLKKTSVWSDIGFSGENIHADLTTSCVSKSVVVAPGSFYTITPSSGSLKRGESITLNVSMQDGYALEGMNVSAGTIQKISDTQYKFTMPSPAVDVTITPVYKQLLFNITKVVNLQGAGTINCVSTAYYGDTVTVSQTPANDEFLFLGWNFSEGQIVDSKFVMPQKDVTVTANYLAHQIIWEKQGATFKQDPSDPSKIIFTNTGVAKDNYIAPLEEMMSQVAKGTSEWTALYEIYLERAIGYGLYKNDTKIGMFDSSGKCIYTMTETESYNSMTDVLFKISAENINKNISYGKTLVWGEHITVSAEAVYRTAGCYVGTKKSEEDSNGQLVYTSVPEECIIYYKPRDLTASEHTSRPAKGNMSTAEYQAILREWERKEAGFVLVEPYVYEDGQWILCSLDGDERANKGTSAVSILGA